MPEKPGYGTFTRLKFVPPPAILPELLQTSRNLSTWETGGLTAIFNILQQSDISRSSFLLLWSCKYVRNSAPTEDFPFSARSALPSYVTYCANALARHIVQRLEGCFSLQPENSILGFLFLSQTWCVAKLPVLLCATHNIQYYSIIFYFLTVIILPKTADIMTTYTQLF